MSISVQTLDTIRVVDPRCDLNSAARRTYKIIDGPQDISYVRISADGGASTNMTFTVNPPSTRVLVNRHMLLQTKFTLRFEGVATAALQTLINASGLPGGTGDLKCDGPRAYPLANAIRSLQVTLNNDRMTQSVNRYWRAMTRYANSFDQQNLDQSTTPTFLDQTQQYAQGGNGSGSRAPLGDYTDNLVVPPRGGWVDCNIVANPAAANIGDNLVAIVELTCAEPIWLSPFQYQRQNQSTGLIGVQNMTIQVDLGGRSAGGPAVPNGVPIASTIGGLAAAIWSHDQAAFGAAADPVRSCSVVVSDAFILASYLTPDMLTVIPPVNSYPYYEPQVYSPAVQGQTAPGASAVLNMNAVQLNSIPSRVYVFVSRADTDMRITDTDTYAALENVNISFDNRDSILSNATSYDLYQIAVKNGTNLSWPQWSSKVGGVLALDFGEDVPLRANQAPSLRGSYNLSMRVQAKNLSTVPQNLQLTVVVVSVGVITIANQNVVRSVGVLTTDDVLASKAQDALPWSPSGDIYGGAGIMDTIKGLFGKFMRFAKPAAGMAAKVLPMVAPEFAPYATGAQSILNTIGDMTGTGLVGGKKVSRAYLKKMLKN
jgi:hypothetical protein